VKKLLLATVVGIVAATAPLSAHADGPGYVGTCRVSTVNDTTPDGTLGGQNVWNGQVNVAVVATTPGDTISASCWIKVGAGGTENKVLDAVGPGTGFAVGAGRATFTAAVTDTVFICTHVTTGSAGSSDICVPLTTTPICPDQVCGDGGLLDQINAQTGIVDATLCPVLVTLGTIIDGLPTNGVLYIDGTGDTYIGGRTQAALFWDCPPYVQ
jgi:hypothetical protein